MHQKRTFGLILAIIAVWLIILPFVVSLNEILTKIIESLKFYTYIESYLVPVELKMLGVLVNLFGIDFASKGNVIIVNGKFAEVTWNCLGWQSLLFLTVSFIVGLTNHRYTRSSISETIIIGILGTFLINLLRMTFIVVLLAVYPPIFSIVYHDYLAAITTIIWLFGFWWFAYKFVLEEKKGM